MMCYQTMYFYKKHVWGQKQLCVKKAFTIVPLLDYITLCLASGSIKILIEISYKSRSPKMAGKSLIKIKKAHSLNSARCHGLPDKNSIWC